MTSRIPLQTYLQDLPRLGSPVEPVLVDPQIQASVPMPQNFVWPDLEVSGTSDAPVLLVSAPGAMGKSYTARALAHSLNVPLIDLSGIRVGSNTLMGRIFRCLGPGLAEEYLTSLGEGGASLILDGTDEAQLLAGREHYIDFLQDIAEIVSGGRNSRQVILLGRPDAMLSTEAALYSYGVKFARVQLSAFNKTQADEMLDKTLDTSQRDGHKYAVHRSHRVPYESLRDAVLQDLSNGLGNHKSVLDEEGWRPVEEFLGYPPVLLALAARLQTENFHDELNRIQNDSRADRRAERGELLQKIIEHILDRESEKVRSRVSEALGFDSHDPRARVIYTRSEQVLRLMAAVSGAPSSVMSPAVLSLQEKAIYDEQVTAFVHDHPFLVDNQLANVVFSDYLRAYLHHAKEEELHGLEREVLLDACQVLGPFFVHFAHSLFGGTLEDESLMDSLIKSFVAGTREQSLFSYSQSKGKSVAHLALMSGDRSKRAPASLVKFHIADPSGVVELVSPIARGAIFTPHAIIFSDVQGTLELGPDLTVVAGEIEVGGNQIVVSGHDDGVDNAVLLFAGEALSQQPKVKLSVSNPEHLAVRFPDPTFQWRPFVIRIAVNTANEAALDQFIIAVRRILFGFRSSAGDPSMYCEMLENLVVGSNEAARVGLDALLELEIVERRGDTYFLIRGRLQPYGFSYVDLQGPNFAEKITPLINSMRSIPTVIAFLTKS